MKTPSYSRRGILISLISALIAGALLFCPDNQNRLLAADKTEKAQPVPIQITADELVTNNKTHAATFKGSVTAVQDDTKLTANQLTIFYKSKSGEASGGTNDIERLEAEGDVRIVFDNKLAVSNHAVYIIDKRKLILEGPGSKVISGQDEITGTKITFYRNDGRMVLESDSKTRVKAVIHSDQRGLN